METASTEDEKHTLIEVIKQCLLADIFATRARHWMAASAVALYLRLTKVVNWDVIIFGLLVLGTNFFVLILNTSALSLTTYDMILLLVKNNSVQGI